MPSVNYPYAVGRIRILENNLLDRGQIQRIRELPMADAVKQLNDWGFAPDYPVKDDVDGMIDFRIKEMRDLVLEVTPDAELTTVFWLPLDAVNLKYLIKTRMLGEKSMLDSELERGVFDLDVLRNCVAEKDYTALGAPLAESLAAVEAELTHVQNPRKMSADVDRAFFAKIFEIIKRRGNAFAKKYFMAKVDFSNILSIYRSRALKWETAELEEMLIPGGNLPLENITAALHADDKKTAELLAREPYRDFIKTQLDRLENGRTEEVSEAFADYLLNIARDERFDSFGFGPVAYFLLRGENECRALRIAFARKRAEQTPATD